MKKPRKSAVKKNRQIFSTSDDHIEPSKSLAVSSNPIDVFTMLCLEEIKYSGNTHVDPTNNFHIDIYDETVIKNILFYLIQALNDRRLLDLSAFAQIRKHSKERRPRGELLSNPEIYYDRLVGLRENIIDAVRSVSDEQLPLIAECIDLMQGGKSFNYDSNLKNIIIYNISTKKPESPQHPPKGQTYDQRPKGENAPEFISRVYKDWLTGEFTRADLRKIDPKADMGLYNWERVHGRAPLNLPTKKERNDRLATLIDAADKPEAAKLHDALRARKHRERNRTKKFE